MVVHFQHKDWPFIGKKPSVQDPGEIGGANAPPNSPTLPRKRGLGRVFAARVWQMAIPCWWVSLGFLHLSSVDFFV